MTEPASAPTPLFAEAALRLQHRLVIRKGLQHLLATWPYAAGWLLAVLVLRFVFGLPWAGGTLALVGLGLWILGCFGWAWEKRPSAYSALSFWDQQTSRSDAFANAWWFEQQPELTAGQKMHLDRQKGFLPDALPSVPKDVPLPDGRWLPVLPVVAAVFFFLPQTGGLSLPDPDLTADAQKVAVQEGKQLAEKKLDADKMQSLNEEEKKELENLQQKVQETAKALQQEQAKTAREVLSELEKRAREAEQLASKLGASDAAWASEQMVTEMRKHADTAELGDAVANKSAEKTGDKAQELADKLRDQKLSNETRERFAETLKEIGKQAQPEDKERTVGQHVIGADKNLAQSLPQEAGNEFQALADKMKTLAAREKAREQLEKLAQQLRQSGSDIAGQGGQGMKQLAGSQAQQSQGSQGQQGQQGQQMMNMQNAPQMQPMQMPGLSSAPPGAGQGNQNQNQGQMGQMSPVPGTGQPMAIVPGSGQPPGAGQNNSNKPMLIAPIPGMPAGQGAGAAAMLGSMPGANPGGLQAGNGTAQMGNAPTPTTKAGQQATVDAQRNTEGSSSVRAVEGQARNEAVGRNTQATTLEAIAAEENALDDQALPPARREQVRRYFTELRKRFEKNN
ncbi:MAG: hypothetical protein ACAI34_03250 [Verrucomicrobium sp.]|nr:hypothetical protein [Verrucomicrobium sp.]